MRLEETAKRSTKPRTNYATSTFQIRYKTLKIITVSKNNQTFLKTLTSVCSEAVQIGHQPQHHFYIISGQSLCSNPLIFKNTNFL
ncbi:MAG: hypothetical protein ACP5IZ_00685 [Thermoprotei archaeon]|jgi:hypothetical protein